MKIAITLVTVITLSCITLRAQQITLPYFDDFETGASGWTTNVDVISGTNWELGTPTVGFTMGAFSGDYCWDVNLNTNYTANATCYLNSPVFDFTGISRATVSFWTMYRAEYLWDYLAVQVSVDKGDTWQFLPFPYLICPDGGIQKWIRSDLSLTSLNGYSSVQFRFMFVSDGSISYDGYSIDDFQIEIDPLGLESIASNAFSFYPNPATGELNFNFSVNIDIDAQVIIYSSEGKNVMQVNANTLSNSSFTDLNLPNGIYSVVFENNDSRVVKKLVVNH